MSNTWKIAFAILIILTIAIFGISLIDVGGNTNLGATTELQALNVNLADFAQAIKPYDWHFPEDFGAHPEFLTEWWYYTGNLATADGRRFGYQFTIFRRAITPQPVQSNSEWRTNQIYLAHFTVSDIADNQFFHEQRLSSAGAGLAGATVNPRYHVWLENWQILAQNDSASLVNIQADAGKFAINLSLQQAKPPALEGDNGLTRRGKAEGNASYYYSLTRLITTGQIRIADETFQVDGFSWKDHEFSTNALDADARGWDWFGLIFDNNTEMMLGQIRKIDKSIEPVFGGLIDYPDGSTEYLDSDSFTIKPINTWTSPHTGAEYPSGWQITVKTSRDTYNFTLTPLLSDQELSDTDPAYWEGAVRIEGDFTGYGYAELTGYAESMQNRF